VNSSIFVVCFSIARFFFFVFSGFTTASAPVPRYYYLQLRFFLFFFSCVSLVLQALGFSMITGWHCGAHPFPRRLFPRIDRVATAGQQISAFKRWPMIFGSFSVGHAPMGFSQWTLRQGFATVTPQVDFRPGPGELSEVFNQRVIPS